LTGGFNASSLIKWAIIDSLNSPNVRCTFTAPTSNYQLYDS